MGTVTLRHAAGRSFDAELTDPALAYLFGPAPAPAAHSPAAKALATLEPRVRPWSRPADVLSAEETLLLLEDGGAFQIREVPDGADFEIFVEEEVDDFSRAVTAPVENLDHFRSEFEADLAVFRGIRAGA